MSEAVFEVRAIPVWHILIFAILCFYMAIGVFVTFSGIAGWSIILIFFAFFGSLFFLFLFSILFSKLRVYEDGISFRMYHVYFDKVGRIKLKWGGRLLSFGKLNWYLLLNPQRFIEAIKAVKPEVLIGYRKPVRKWKPLFYSIIPLVSLAVLWAIGYALRCLNIVIDSFAWALVWGITATLSTAAWVYWLPPHRYRLLGLRQARNINYHRLSNWDTHISNNAHKTIHVGGSDMEKWPRKWYWIAILVVVSISVYTAWHLQLNPQHIPVFLATAIIALGFVAMMALLPKYRQRLVKKVLEHHVKQREMGGRLYRYYRVALLIIIACALVFPVVFQYQLIASQYIPLFVFIFFIVNLAAGVIFIAGFLKARGKWGLLLIAVIFASVLLGILVGWLTKHG